MTADLTEHFARILSAPVLGHLATVRHHGSVQVNPMWFEFDGDAGVIRFTHTTKRAKYRNLQRNPHMTLEALDPENPLRLRRGARPPRRDRARSRGSVLRAPRESAMARPYPHVPADKADRVILVMQIEKIAGR